MINKIIRWLFPTKELPPPKPLSRGAAIAGLAMIAGMAGSEETDAEFRRLQKHYMDAIEAAEKRGER